MLNTIQTNPAKHDNLMQRVVEMFVKRSLSAEGNMDKIREYDAELSYVFLNVFLIEILKFIFKF